MRPLAGRSGVNPSQRFTRNNPCPVCGGHATAPRGKEQRCYGFESSDGQYAHCTREEYAGLLAPHKGGDTYAHRLAGECRCGTTHGLERTAPSSAKGNGARQVKNEHAHAPEPAAGPQRRVAEYVYEDRNGEPLRRKVRLEPGPGGRAKTFVWEHPDGGGWKRSKGDGNPHVLYALPLVVEAEVVHLGEGEKAADALNAHFAEHGMADHAATCAPTTQWEPEFTQALRAKRVVLWCDRDEDGEKQAVTPHVALQTVGVRVEAVRAAIPAEKADAADHLERVA